MLQTFQQSFSFIPLLASEEICFFYILANLVFLLPWQLIKFSGVDELDMFRKGLFKEYFCKTFVNICSEIAINANFHFPRYVITVDIPFKCRRIKKKKKKKKKKNNNNLKKKKRKEKVDQSINL